MQVNKLNLAVGSYSNQSVSSTNLEDLGEILTFMWYFFYSQIEQFLLFSISMVNIGDIWSLFYVSTKIGMNKLLG